MARAYVVNLGQASVLKHLHRNGAVSAANETERYILESLVDRGLAIKHNIGRGVTFSISGQGRSIYKSLYGTEVR